MKKLSIIALVVLSSCIRIPEIFQRVHDIAPPSIPCDCQCSPLFVKVETLPGAFPGGLQWGSRVDLDAGLDTTMYLYLGNGWFVRNGTIDLPK